MLITTHRILQEEETAEQLFFHSLIISESRKNQKTGKEKELKKETEMTAVMMDFKRMNMNRKQKFASCPEYQFPEKDYSNTVMISFVHPINSLRV